MQDGLNHWYSGALLSVLHDALPCLHESETKEFWRIVRGARPHVADMLHNLSAIRVRLSLTSCDRWTAERASSVGGPAH